MRTRTKKLTYDGAEYYISPLMLEEADEMVLKFKVPKELSSDDQAEAKLTLYDDTAIEIICLCVNRAEAALLAAGKLTEVQPLDPKTCRKDTIDRKIIKEIYLEILSFSGLRADPTPGETIAALENSSSKSDAA